MFEIEPAVELECLAMSCYLGDTQWFSGKKFPLPEMCGFESEVAH